MAGGEAEGRIDDGRLRGWWWYEDKMRRRDLGLLFRSITR